MGSEKVRGKNWRKFFSSSPRNRRYRDSELAQDGHMWYNLYVNISPRDATNVRGLIHRSVIPMNTPNDTTDSTKMKRCSRGDECVHPDGPNLPATPKYFYKDTHCRDGLRSECKLCNAKMIGVTPRVVAPEGYKQCGAGNKCVTEGGPILPATSEYFWPDRSHGDSLRSYCKSCAREWHKRYCESNPERMRTLEKAYRQRHTEEVNARKRKRRQDHPEIERVKHQRRAAKKRELPATFTSADWRYALDYFHGRCAYCGNPPQLFDYYLGLHQEHHIPLVRGGGYTPGNILPACQNCNLSKGDKLPEEWIAARFGKKSKGVLQTLGVFFETVRKDSPEVLIRLHMTPGEKAALRRKEARDNPPATKLCGNKGNCAHPNGPDLPLIKQYFALDSSRIDGFDRVCKMCRNAAERRRNRDSATTKGKVQRDLPTN